MLTQSYPISGMHCTSCAAIIEKNLKKLEGVSEVGVNYGTETAKITFDEGKARPENFAEKVKELGYSLRLSFNSGAGPKEDVLGMAFEVEQTKKIKLGEIDSIQKKLFFLVPLGLISLMNMIWEKLVQIQVLSSPSPQIDLFLHVFMPLAASYALFIAGWRYLVGIYRFLGFGRADLLG